MKKSKLFILISIIIILLLALLLSVFLLKKDTNSPNENANIENNKTEDSEQLNYKFFKCSSIPLDNKESINNIYYKKIDSYEEYTSYKSSVYSLPKCETNFDKNFIIVIMTENVSTQYLVPYKVYNENDKLYVGLIKDAKTNPEYNAIILEIPKNLEKDTIEIYKAIDEDIPHENFVSLKDLPETYSAEDATSDNCFVLGDGELVINQNLAEEFINNYNNSQDTFLRIVKFAENTETIIDVYYSSTENKFLVCVDNTRAHKNSTYNYYKFSDLNKITLQVGRDGSTDFYTLSDPYESDMELFYI